ncbi:hypothetical protein NUSPORA_02107 [Nucleospora cyclopteri]
MKYPNCIDFNASEYEENEEAKSLQVRQKQGISNTKLCKRRDGTWFMQNGNIKMELNSIKIKGMKVVETSENGGRVIGTVNNKWFVKGSEILKKQ